jgi:hypothetical protein
MAKAEKPKQKPKPSKKTQYGRFVEAARKLDCDESEQAFEDAFAKIVPPKDPVARHHAKQSADEERRKK